MVAKDMIWCLDRLIESTISSKYIFTSEHLAATDGGASSEGIAHPLFSEAPFARFLHDNESSAVKISNIIFILTSPREGVVF